MRPNANDLILFAQLMEVGSFSRAAERTGLPKSTLSRRITELEALLGERLLTRSTRQLLITEFGEHVLQHAKRLLEEADAISDMVQHREITPRGLLRVSLPVDFDEIDLSALLQGYTTRYPEVRLELDISPRRVDLLTERFDLAVRIASHLPEDNTLIARKLCDLQNGLYASPAYLAHRGNPVQPDDLLAHQGLQLQGGNGDILPWRLECGNQVWEGVPNGPVVANSPWVLRDMAIRGMGITSLGDRKAYAWVAQGLLVRVLPEWCLPQVSVWCVMPCRRLMPTRTSEFIEMMRNAIIEGK